MRYLLLTICLIFFACDKKQEQPTVNSLERVLEKRDFYLSQINKHSDDVLFPARCDKLTFKGFASAFGADMDISAHEYQPGEWHRDIDLCFPHASRSEISFDGLLGVIHHSITKGDSELRKRLSRYASDHAYVMGEGDRELTYTPQIGLILAEMEGYSLAEWTGSHREHILAMSVYLRGRYKGYILSSELASLKALGSSPIFDALIARYTDGNQSKAIDALMDSSIFPEDRLPTLDGAYGWGSCPYWVYYLITTSIIEGV